MYVRYMATLLKTMDVDMARCQLAPIYDDLLTRRQHLSSEQYLLNTKQMFREKKQIELEIRKEKNVNYHLRKQAFCKAVSANILVIKHSFLSSLYEHTAQFVKRDN